MALTAKASIKVSSFFQLECNWHETQKRLNSFSIQKLCSLSSIPLFNHRMLANRIKIPKPIVTEHSVTWSQCAYYSWHCCAKHVEIFILIIVAVNLRWPFHRWKEVCRSFFFLIEINNADEYTFFRDYIIRLKHNHFMLNEEKESTWRRYWNQFARIPDQSKYEKDKRMCWIEKSWIKFV